MTSLLFFAPLPDKFPGRGDFICKMNIKEELVQHNTKLCWDSQQSFQRITVTKNVV